MIHEFREIVDSDTPPLVGNLAQFHAAFCELHPAVDIGRILNVWNDDIVSLSPVQAIGDGDESLGGILDERDFLGGRAD